ncbi:hypothetical protein [Flavobacterium macacae]|uniref:hypothetical protein n=1 Tax=Flavobacterium macacae TaxID=2488993 RepID=UPI00131550CB|nr:hypothetical protein [Flavobacterium macacae]
MNEKLGVFRQFDVPLLLTEIPAGATRFAPAFWRMQELKQRHHQGYFQTFRFF